MYSDGRSQAVANGQKRSSGAFKSVAIQFDGGSRLTAATHMDSHLRASWGLTTGFP